MRDSRKTVLATALLATTALGAGLYPSSSSILQVDASSYGRLIESSNYTSILEFYAPWCGHCRNLAPAYEKAASSLKGLATVAAINCDEDANKPFCGQMGVQGFPTLKIIKPSPPKNGKRRKPVVSDYQGPREAKGIVEAVKDKIVNHATRVKDDTLTAFLEQSPKPKALFFSEKGLVPPLVKALAIDFLGSVDIGFVRNGDAAVVKKYGITSFPGVVLVDASGEATTFDGEFKKPALLEFLGKAASPNPDASKETASRAKPVKKAASSKSTSTSASTSASATSAQPKPTASVVTLETEQALKKACLHEKASTCILALGSSPEVIDSLTGIATKHVAAGTKLFPIYLVPASNAAPEAVKKALSLQEESVVAVNAKRGWFTAPQGKDLEAWIDGIRLGDLVKQDLPPSLLQETVKHEEL